MICSIRWRFVDDDLTHTLCGDDETCEALFRFLIKNCKDKIRVCEVRYVHTGASYGFSYKMEEGI